MKEEIRKIKQAGYLVKVRKDYSGYEIHEPFVSKLSKKVIKKVVHGILWGAKGKEEIKESMKKFIKQKKLI